MKNGEKLQNANFLKNCIYIDKKVKPKFTKYNNIFDISWKSLSYKGFNVDTKYFIFGRNEMYNKALSLYFTPLFEQFPMFFFNELKQVYMFVIFYFYILWSHFSKVILNKWSQPLLKVSHPQQKLYWPLAKWSQSL